MHSEVKKQKVVSASVAEGSAMKDAFGKYAEYLNELLADLTGDLMRLVMGRISEGELEFGGQICDFVPKMDDNSDMIKKMDVMLRSVIKIENACYSVHVRGSEHIPLLGTNEPSYSLPGAPEADL